MYKCEICGKSYEELEGRIECETKCFKERKAAEEKRKEAELAAKKEARRAEVEAAQKNYLELLEKYVEDYGIFSTKNAGIFPHWTDYFLY